MFDIYDGRLYLWQWDSEIRLVMDEFEVGTKVHFTNGIVEETLVTLVYENDEGVKVCNVPNILLTTDDEIVVYAYLEDTYGNRTYRRKIITVKARKKPSDYIYTETEVVTYKGLEKRIETLEGKKLIATDDGEGNVTLKIGG